MGKLYNQRYSKEIRKDLRNHPTQAELKLWQKLKSSQIGHKFRRQHGIENYIADFCCPKLRLVIEIDGYTHDDPERIKRDKEKEDFLINRGLTVKRLTDNDVLENIEGTIVQITMWCDELVLKS